ncbi:hypothetical protein A8C32_07295 [Flavivirga aquatica]|uniref:Capsular biosynthesis protein n=1 Tax=Flavivirga aquatica TaxID=1849968 RepID=A0A1E5SIN0_9FLAO|nr:hypothetical protein [Flavivirga aquatica]OEJ98979.1 hypothetical protein A8C32_07295 [Flavivirga aquatica]
MKIICIGTLDKFSRFYLKIKENLKTDNKNHLFHIYSIHFSGFMYTLLRFKFSSWLPAKGWFNALINKKKYLRIIENKNQYKNINYKNFITFHLKLNPSLSKISLLIQALSYIDILDDILKKKRPDAIILLGDSRLSIEICIALAKVYNIKVYFIEQGPFNTTFFDPQGVNANASINNINLKNASLPTKEQIELVDYLINKPKQKKYKRSPIYRGIDYSLAYFFEKSYLFPPDLKYTDTFPKFYKFKQQVVSPLSIKPKGEIKLYLLILQVPLDVNMIYHSPNFKNHFEIVKAIHKNLPKNSKLILREHPIYKDKYDKELYDYVIKHNLSFDNHISLKDSLKQADVIVVNNSTVGIEAISLKKTVVVLANAYYRHPEICIKYTKNDNLNSILTKALNFKPKEQFIYHFLYNFLTQHLIEGFITDENLNAPKSIAKKINKSYT